MAQLLVIADREVNDPTAIKRAAHLAEQMGDSLHIVTFAHESLSDLDDLVTEDVVNTLMKSVLEQREAAAKDHLAKIKVKARVTAIWEKDVASWVTEHARSKKYRCVVKTGANTSTLFYTSTDWRLMRECPIPVMILAKKKWKKRNRILATVDLSSKSTVQKALNERVVSQALEMAANMGGSVHVCNVVPVPKVLMDLDLVDSRSVKKKAKAKAKVAMEALLNDRVDKRHYHLELGEPHRKIPSLANKLKADMVVMGSLGRKGAKGRLLGNTAEKTLNKLYTDIFTLRPE